MCYNKALISKFLVFQSDPQGIICQLSLLFMHEKEGKPEIIPYKVTINYLLWYNCKGTFHQLFARREY